MKTIVMVSTVAALILLPYAVKASDFLGASVTDRDVPMSAWKEGMIGIRPTIHEVPLNSIAEESGLKNGDVIVSVNGTGVKASKELHKFPKGDLSIVVFRWGERKTLTISKSAFEPKVTKNARHGEDPAISAARKSRSVRERPDTSPPIVFNDDTLERRFGRSTPAPPAKDSAKVVHGSTGARKEYRQDRDTLYGGKPLYQWKMDFSRLCNEINRIERDKDRFSDSRYDSSPSVRRGRELRKTWYDNAISKINMLIEDAKNAGIPSYFISEFLNMLDHPSNKSIIH